MIVCLTMMLMKNSRQEYNKSYRKSSMLFDQTSNYAHTVQRRTTTT
jgi:hypothetical protein